jgi:hypothetical protein
MMPVRRVLIAVKHLLAISSLRGVAQHTFSAQDFRRLLPEYYNILIRIHKQIHHVLARSISSRMPIVTTYEVTDILQHVKNVIETGVEILSQLKTTCQ